MPHFDRWLTGLPHNATASRAARRAIGSRLRAVAHYLGRVAEAKKPAEGDVHDLRIWTRRAQSALRLFRKLLPDKARRRMRRTLRKVRRRAGRVRDIDRAIRQFEAGGGLAARLERQLRSRRRQARRRLRSTCKRLLRHSRLERASEHLVQQIGWKKGRSGRKGPGFDTWAREELRPAAQQFLDLVEMPLVKAEDWHRLRIAGKEWRYGLELSIAALRERPSERLYALLSEMQDLLGAVCDCLADSELLRKSKRQAGGRLRPALDSVLLQQARKLATAERQFLRWWTPARRRRINALWHAALAVRSDRG